MQVQQYLIRTEVNDDGVIIFVNPEDIAGPLSEICSKVTYWYNTMIINIFRKQHALIPTGRCLTFLLHNLNCSVRFAKSAF